MPLDRVLHFVRLLTEKHPRSAGRSTTRTSPQRAALRTSHTPICPQRPGGSKIVPSDLVQPATEGNPAALNSK